MEGTYPQGIRRIIARLDPGWPPLEVNPGWYPLLEDLDARLAEIAPDYRVQQVKSKFGALSFFARPSDDPYDYSEEFAAAILAAEWASTEVCEECGAPARQYVIRMWVWTMCALHAEERRSTSEQ